MAESSEEQLSLVEDDGAIVEEPTTEEEPTPRVAAAAVDHSERDALRAELQATRERLARIEGEVAAASRTRSAEAEAPRELTRSELRQMVDMGTITEDEMQDRIDAQNAMRLERSLAQKLEQRLAMERQEAALSQQFQSYRDAIDGLDAPGHPNRERVAREYAELVRAGLPEGRATELAALKAAFGAPTKIRETTRERRETHREAGGSSGAAEQRPGPQWMKGLKQPQIDYLKNQLDKGVYKGTDDPGFKDYIKYARGEGAVH